MAGLGGRRAAAIPVAVVYGLLDVRLAIGRALFFSLGIGLLLCLLAMCALAGSILKARSEEVMARSGWHLGVCPPLRNLVTDLAGVAPVENRQRTDCGTSRPLLMHVFIGSIDGFLNEDEEILAEVIVGKNSTRLHVMADYARVSLKENDHRRALDPSIRPIADLHVVERLQNRKSVATSVYPHTNIVLLVRYLTKGSHG